jgi:hypothetical protein
VLHVRQIWIQQHHYGLLGLQRPLKFTLKFTLGTSAPSALLVSAHPQGKSPAMSRYNPLDLFRNNSSDGSSNLSGSSHSPDAAPQGTMHSSSSSSSSHELLLLLLCQQAALAALLECPYNNLKVCPAAAAAAALVAPHSNMLLTHV